MSALKNPYLTYDAQNLLLRKNYKVIQQSSKKPSFYPNYEQNISKSHNFLSPKNHQSFQTTTGFSSSSNFRNPFQTKALNEMKQNYPHSYSNLPSFYTQPYLPSLQKKQLPFPSYNRPESNRQMTSFSALKIAALSRRNLGVPNIKISSTQSLQKNISSSTLYRPHFISPTSKNISLNDWNTQRWKKQIELKQRQKLSKYGSQALRYDGKLLLRENNNIKSSNLLNNEYYSTSSIQRQMIYRIHVQKPPQHHLQYKQKQKKRQIFLFNQIQNDQPQLQIQNKKLTIFSNVNKHKNNPNLTYQSSSSSNLLSIPKDPDGFNQYRRKQLIINNTNKVNNNNRFSDIHEQSQIENLESNIISGFNHKIKNLNDVDDQQQSMLAEQRYLSIVGNNNVDDGEFQDGRNLEEFMSKYSQTQKDDFNRLKSNGPLDMDAFDSIHNRQQNSLYNKNKQSKFHSLRSSQVNIFGGETFGVKKNKRFMQQQQSQFQQKQKQKNTIKDNSNNELKSRKTLLQLKVKNRNQNQQNNNHIDKDYPQKIEYNGRLFFRIKLNEDRK